MITNLVLGLVSLIITVFNGFLPSLSVPSWFTTDAFSSVATTTGDLLAGVRGIFPVDAVLTVLIALLTLLPVFVAYRVFQWVWDHVPTIAGFGTK